MSRRKKLFYFMVIASAFNVALLIYRAYSIGLDFSYVDSLYELSHHEQTPTFFFLIWNLYLAWIPYFVILVLQSSSFIQSRNWLLGIGLIVWLLFFPNAPYLITDLLHLRPYSNVPYWYDTFIFFAFAWTGLMLGTLSLIEARIMFMQKIGHKGFVNFIIISLLGLCGLGVYIGRFERWNSWDIIAHPFGILKDIFEVIQHPFTNLSTFGLAIVLSVFLWIVFSVTKLLLD